MYQDKIITAEEVRNRSQDGFKFSKAYHLTTERILEAAASEADILDIAWNQRGISFCTKKGEQWDCSHSIGKQITKEEFDEVMEEVKKGWKDLLQPYEGEQNSYKLLLYNM